MPVRTRTYRTPSLVAMVLLATLALGACEADEPEEEAGAEATETETETDDEEADTDGPVEGGQLVVGIGADPGHLNPAVTTSGGLHTASELFYNGLVGLDDDLEPVPELAEDWDIEEDGALYRFHLRDDVVWHDGEPFTSEDVQFTFEEALLPYHARTQASMEPVLDRIETPDEHTVEFYFDEPYSPMLQQLDVTEAPIIAQHVYEGTDPEQNEEANQNPVGTGPYQFVSYEGDEEIRAERNEDYFVEDAAYLDEVIQRIIPEESSQVVALEAGDVDWLWGVPGPDIERFESAAEYETLETNRNPGGANCIMTVGFNLEDPMFQDNRVRQAVAHAVDRDAYVERVLFGQGRAATAPISSGIPVAHPDDLDLPEHDPEQAAQLLEEAGWVESDDGDVRVAEGVEGVEDGTELAFDFLHFPQFEEYGDLLRSQLGEIGAELELRGLEFPVFVETVFTERDFDTGIVSYCNGTDPQIGVRRMYMSDNIGPVPFSNMAGYQNEQVDELFNEARRTVDTDERSEVYRELQEILVDELPYVWIVETTATRVHTAECAGFQPYGLFVEQAYCDR